MAVEDKKAPAKASSPAYRHTPQSLKPNNVRRSRRRKTAILTALVIVFGVAAGFFAYKYHQANNNAKLLADPKAAASAQIDDLVAKVGKLVLLPTGERPTVATVTDLSKLQGQAFFAPAQNGDKVMIYTQAKKAVLYRPSTNKVIEIAPLNLGSSSSGTSTDASATPPATPTPTPSASADDKAAGNVSSTKKSTTTTKTP